MEYFQQYSVRAQYFYTLGISQFIKLSNVKVKLFFGTFTIININN